MLRQDHQTTHTAVNQSSALAQLEALRTAVNESQLARQLETTRTALAQSPVLAQLEAVRTAVNESQLARQLEATRTALAQSPVLAQLEAVRTAVNESQLARQLEAVQVALDRSPVLAQLEAMRATVNQSHLARQIETVQTAFDTYRVDLAALKTAVTQSYGRDRALMEAALAAAQKADVDGSPLPPDGPAQEADAVDVWDPRIPSESPEVEDRAGASEPVAPKRMRVLWSRLKDFLLVDGLLGNPVTNAIRAAVGETLGNVGEAGGNLANEILLCLWLAAVAEAPSPPSASTAPTPYVPAAPVQILEEPAGQNRTIREALGAPEHHTR